MRKVFLNWVTSSFQALQVRALAVCRDWKASLDPQSWPLEKLHVSGHTMDHGGRSVASWVTTTQPALRSLQVDDDLPPHLLPDLLLSLEAKTVRHSSWLASMRKGDSRVPNKSAWPDLSNPLYTVPS